MRLGPSQTVDTSTPCGRHHTYHQISAVTNTGNTAPGWPDRHGRDGRRQNGYLGHSSTLPPNVTDDDGDGISPLAALPSQGMSITATYKVVATDAGELHSEHRHPSLMAQRLETPMSRPKLPSGNPNVSINKTVSGMSGADNQAVER